MSEPFLGQIQSVGFNFAPRGWSTCHGQTLPISQNTALFSLFGTIYGGDGRTTFGLPELRGRIPLDSGQGPGLPNYPIGSKSGNYQHQLTVQQMPSHNHTAVVHPHCNSSGVDTNEPEEAFPGATADNEYNSVGPEKMGAADVTIGLTGGGQAFNIQNPYQAILWVVALVGLYPSRN